MTAVALSLAIDGCAPRTPAADGEAGGALSTRASTILRRFEYSQVHMGVRARIVVHAEAESKAQAAAKAAFDRIAALDAIMSDYRSDSELMRLCDRAGDGQAVSVSDDLFAILRLALIVHEASDGAFDVTVGPATRLWRHTRQAGALPGADERARARALIGSDKIVLDESARTVRLLAPGMRLDLGGIAKGYACEAASEVLDAHDCPIHLIALAGDIVVGDAPPGRDGWVIDAQSGEERADTEEAALGRASRPSDDIPLGQAFPRSDSRDDRFTEEEVLRHLDRIVLTNAAVSTSGGAVQFVEIDGWRYSHIVDPRTGLGAAPPDVHAVTVIAHDGATVDALATALTLLDSSRWPDVLARFPGAEAIAPLR